MIPDYQSLMRHVLACAAAGETKIGDAVEQLADKLGLTPDCPPGAKAPRGQPGSPRSTLIADSVPK
jgi:hypothetical protein